MKKCVHAFLFLSFSHLPNPQYYYTTTHHECYVLLLLFFSQNFQFPFQLYLNLCSSPHVEEPHMGDGGWAVPYSVAGPRTEKKGKKGRNVTVFDFLFGKQAMARALADMGFRKVLAQTAIESLEEFGPKVDKRLVKPLKDSVKYIGAKSNVLEIFHFFFSRCTICEDC